MEMATSESWRKHGCRKKPSEISKPKLLKTDLVFGREEFNKLEHGFLPMSMDDKWLIYMEDEHLHFLRSWTNFETYRAKVEQEGDQYRIREFLVERDPRHSTAANDEEDVRLLSDLIQHLLLDRSLWP